MKKTSGTTVGKRGRHEKKMQQMQHATNLDEILLTKVVEKRTENTTQKGAKEVNVGGGDAETEMEGGILEQQNKRRRRTKEKMRRGWGIAKGTDSRRRAPTDRGTRHSWRCRAGVTPSSSEGQPARRQAELDQPQGGRVGTCLGPKTT